MLKKCEDRNKSLFKLKTQYIFLLLSFLLLACSSKKEQETTPWGTPINEDGSPVVEEQGDSTSRADNAFSLKDIQSSGELIMLTVSGPETYYDYHGHGLGAQYLMCEKFAEKLGVSLRVELCADSAEVVRKINAGEGDIAVFADYKTWKLSDPKGELAQKLREWYTPQKLASVKKEQEMLLKHGFVKRHVYPFMLNRKDAVISKYDGLFREYASIAKLDWTLIAAQCYQESCFDPKAHSWAGACGLMQILPTTADHLGLPRDEIYQPAANILAACRYMAELQGKFSDIRSRQERICFALASYNGGYHHVRDAMALAEKYGKNPQRWSDVSEFILGLQSSKYYSDPVVKYGYMRGSETADYVAKIMDRWRSYSSATHGKFPASVTATPRPSSCKNKYDKE